MNSHSPQTRDDRYAFRSSRGATTIIQYRKITLLLVAIFALLLGACSGTAASAVKSFTKGDEVAYYDFTEPGTFEEGSYGDGNVRLEIREGAYHMDLSVGDSTLWYGQWGATLRDVVVDVEATQTTESQNTTYGVICRARGTVGQVAAKPDADLSALASESSGSLVASAAQAPESTAPAEATAEATSEATQEATAEVTSEATQESTLEATSEATTEATAEATTKAPQEATAEVTTAPITEIAPEATPESTATPLDANNINNGDGYLFLIEGSGKFAIMRSRGRSVSPLVDWTDSSTIKVGPAENRIRVVCMGDYLAMYINGTFVGDATDDTYTQGQIGMVAAASDRLGNQVSFDNLSVSEAKPG